MRPIRVPVLSNRLVLLSLGLAAMLVAGCGEGRLATYPVTGTVLVDGQPAGGAQLIFCPVGGSEELSRVRPAAETGPDGKFEVTTFDPLDGAPAGEYNVMIRWPAQPPTQAAGDAERVRRPRDRLRGRYFNPETSGITATVNEEATELPPFQLSAR